jgi:hypothetical protein
MAVRNTRLADDLSAQWIETYRRHETRDAPH